MFNVSDLGQFPIYNTCIISFTKQLLMVPRYIQAVYTQMFTHTALEEYVASEGVRNTGIS